MSAAKSQEPGLYGDNENEDSPPIYSAASNPAASVESYVTREHIPGLPNIRFTKYAPPNSNVSKDLATTTIIDAALCKKPEALLIFLRDQLALPPVPEIRVKGTHRAGHGEEVDFDIRLNMLQYFLPRNGEQGLAYTKIISCGSGPNSTLAGRNNATQVQSVEQLANAFCTDASTDKSILIARKLIHWDTEYLLGRIHGLILSLNYKGRTDITFPVYRSRTLLKPAHATLASTLRAAFIGPSKATYEIESVQPYATHAPADDGDDSPDARSANTAGRPNHRTCLVRSERAWFAEWRPVLRAAVLARRKGWVGVDDWMEVALLAMPGPRDREEKPAAWGTDA